MSSPVGLFDNLGDQMYQVFSTQIFALWWVFEANLHIPGCSELHHSSGEGLLPFWRRPAPGKKSPLSANTRGFKFLFLHQPVQVHWNLSMVRYVSRFSWVWLQTSSEQQVLISACQADFLVPCLKNAFPSFYLFITHLSCSSFSLSLNILTLSTSVCTVSNYCV